MGRTILRTQQRFRQYIAEHAAEDTSLRRGEDPYESDPRWEDCFVGVATWPTGTSLLSYGMVYNVLEGLWLYMYRGDILMTGVFEVKDDQFGIVGIGKIAKDRPD